MEKVYKPKNSIYSLIQLISLTLVLSTSQSSEIISRFQHYLQINTAQPNPDYTSATNFILSQSKALNLESQTIEFVKGKPVILLKWIGKYPKLPSILLNSHTDVVPVEQHKWTHPPFNAHIDEVGHIYARGSQDMKCVGLQYLEAIRALKDRGFEPVRTVYVSFVPDEEIGGHDGAEKFAQSEVFEKMNVGIVLDEGLASPNENYRVFYGESRSRIIEKRIAEEWAPSSRNMTFQLGQFKQKGSVHDKSEKPALTAADMSNPWWVLLEEAVKKANRKLDKPEVFPASTDARYFRERGLPAIGFSPMANTPVLLHDHNEFLNKAEYLKGVEIYESIIKDYASYIEKPSGDRPRKSCKSSIALAHVQDIVFSFSIVCVVL
ncbi:hypothetical protein IFM89_020389 [Coptis chinensis]|uniref:N-acyl-aliphatic-L-amino acid amidohydrolase n=1 Tax=Coptis chinensis TaxID=261450 RepID=A0A835INV5_9MAGN|nr:hypothetical protein IFM89_020389 [Coptis chinensis]